MIARDALVSAHLPPSPLPAPLLPFCPFRLPPFSLMLMRVR